MSFHAREFFAELMLPFPHSTVVGNTYYATPTPGSSLRLCIEFAPTIYADTYGGLRASVVHSDRGEINAVALSFVDHGTFHRRDEAKNTPRNNSTYATFNTRYHQADQPPWEGVVTTGLRDAIEQYCSVWFPGSWPASPPPRTTARTARHVPASASSPARRRT
ncbi:hypothetical protein [Streptomyces sp. GbtcB7]|uniref:hypothetical protein n=1 Tax=Streptomyces sp. GbtcB7 TaxID=2824752 RepID=UPI001C30B001|nr:hypothetical protein [Streptomyces sp. GbtcB7]